MAHNTVRRNLQVLVVWISRLVKVLCVATNTGCVCTLESGCVTLQAIDCSVGSRKRKHRHIMVKDHIGISRGVTSETGGVLIGIPLHSCVLIVGFRVLVTGYTCKQIPLAGCVVALHTFIPHSLMLAAVDRKIHSVMVKGGWLPGSFCMALSTLYRELQLDMIRILCTGVILTVASITGIGCIGIVAIVAGRTVFGDQGMGSVKGIICIVFGKFGRGPTGIRAMTLDTICPYSKRTVGWIDGLLVVLDMATHTGSGCTLKSVGMALQAFY